MPESPVGLRKEGKISIITIDDGKANVFGLPMTQALSAASDEIGKKEGAVVVEGREGLYSGCFGMVQFAGLRLRSSRYTTTLASGAKQRDHQPRAELRLS